ncbi:Pecanex-like protein 4 [Tritrichomonas musculus]|uniref:Pecanex-like protein 4 n=1 Tax=Tritrichomonas musculus TaxID=1915356 RepID=A0ABR2H6L6_9EUKA
MTTLIDISRSFFGGLELDRANKQIHWIIVYLVLYSFYSFYYYVPELQTKNARLIGCGVVLSIILILKIAFFIIRFLISLGFDNEIPKDELESQEEICPSQIPSDVWKYKSLLSNAGANIDSEVLDLINIGVDPAGLMTLIDYLQDTNQMGKSTEIEQPDVFFDNHSSFNKTEIKIGNRIYTLPFTIHQIDYILPSTPSLICILVSVIFGFSSSYLSMSLTSEFKSYEKCFLSFVLASSTFSIIQPPNVDPYNTSINDPWNSCARPFIVTFFCSLWRLILDYLCEPNTHTANDSVLYQIYGIRIEWNVILPYIFIILRYGLFFSLIMFVGFYGHPITSFVAYLESCGRYFFGQNGAGGFLHLFVQLIRGSASVAAVWGFLQIKDPKSNFEWEVDIYDSTLSDPLVKCTKHHSLIICSSIAVSTLINLFPVLLNSFLIKHWFSTFFFPIIAAVISFIIPCIYTVAIHDRYDEMRWFCFAWLLVFELIFPYLYSANKYFCFHFLIFSPLSFVSIFRYISSLIIAPLYLSLSLQTINVYHKMDNLILAFIITHAVHKIHSECHIFALAAFISSLTLPEDFGKKDPTVNLFLSLLIATRIETVLPAIKIILNSRYYQLFFDELFELDDLPYFGKFITAKIVNNLLILVDVIVKIPTLFWCVLFGGGFGPGSGIPYILLPHPHRPNYFFDWPKNLNAYRNIDKDTNTKTKNVGAIRSPTSQLSIIFEKNIDEHPIETPVYMSAVRSIAKSLGPVIKSGRLGYVDNGNMYIFKSKNNNAAFFLHVISIEPSCFRFQLRGLEYKSQTLCHEGEESNLDAIANDYEFSILSFNTHAAFAATATDYDFRSYSVNLSMYDVSTTPVSQAFIGIEDDVKFQWFIYAFSFAFKKFIGQDNSQFGSSLNLSSNENTMSSGNLLGDSFGNFIEILRVKFNELPPEIGIFSFIQQSQPLFERILQFFVGADSQGYPSFEEEALISCLHEGEQQGRVPPIVLVFNLFSLLVSSLFDKDRRLVLQNAASNFCGDKVAVHEWAVDFISSVPSEIRQAFLREFIQLGYIYCFLASCSVLDIGSTDEGQLPSNETLTDIFQQLTELSDSTVIAPINSQQFIREFTIGDRMLIAITGDKVLRFALSSSNWCVFQINQDYARGIWSEEARDILFFGDEDSERMSIQENIYFLNNLIIQSCETPIGYPAYSSEIFEAYANPFIKGNLIFV